MARCGCTTFPTCSCVIVGDGLTTTVFGNGAQPSPYQVSVVGYPRPRPQGYLAKTTSTVLVDGVDSTISFVTGGNSSQPTTMWNVATPTRLLIPTTGTYLITSGIIHSSLIPSGLTYICSSFDGFLTSDSGTRRGKQTILKNGATTITAKHNGYRATGGVSNGDYHIITVARLVAGDYLELLVKLSSMVDAETSPSLNAAYLGARWMGL